MKRKGIRKIEFKKSIISNFNINKVTGGSRTSNICSAVCSGQCDPVSETCFTMDGGSACRCK